MKLMLNGTVDLRLTPEGCIGLVLDGLTVTVVDEEPRAEAVRNGSRTSADQAEERGFDSRPPLHPIEASTFGGSSAGAHGNHRRYGHFDPGCRFCLAGTSQRPRSEARSDRSEAPESPIHAQNGASRSEARSDRSDIDRTNDYYSIDRPPSDLPPSLAASDLIDLERPDIRVLKRKWSRGGRSPRPPHLKAADLARLDAVARCPEHDVGWSAAVLDGARGDLIKALERQHTELHRPPAPDPAQVAEASTHRRDAVLAGYRELVERGEASDVVRALFERMTTQEARGP